MAQAALVVWVELEAVVVVDAVAPALLQASLLAAPRSSYPRLFMERHIQHEVVQLKAKPTRKCCVL